MNSLPDQTTEYPVHSFSRGKVITESGDSSGSAYVLESGQVAVVRDGTQLGIMGCLILHLEGQAVESAGSFEPAGEAAELATLNNDVHNLCLIEPEKEFQCAKHDSRLMQELVSFRVLHAVQPVQQPIPGCHLLQS